MATTLEKELLVDLIKNPPEVYIEKVVSGKFLVTVKVERIGATRTKRTILSQEKVYG